jgi:SLT domain-containing protein
MSDTTETTETHKIANFIKSVNERNYAQANKYLQKTIHQKLTTKISQSKPQSIFQKQ